MAARRVASEAVVQELGPSPTQHARVGWGEQKRASVLDVQRYSRFVIVMKRALPLAAVALLAVVVAYSLVPRQPDQAKIAFQFHKLGIINDDLTMFDPKLTGVDSSGNPFVVTAEQAVQYTHDPDKALLKTVDADLTLKDGNWLNITAPRGLLNMKHAHDEHCAKTKCAGTQLLDLFGPVAMFSDNGYEVHTSVAHIDLGTGIARGNRYIRGQGPLGTFNADSFVFQFHGRQDGVHASHKGKGSKNDPTAMKKLFLYGNVHMTIFRSGSRQS